MLPVTTVRRAHRELLSLLIIGSFVILAAHTADAAHSQGPHTQPSSTGTESAPLAGQVR